MRTSVEPELKQQIINEALAGERIPELATRHSVNVTNIYNWVAKAKQDAGIPTVKREGSTGLGLVSLDEQIATLTAKYQKELKGLLLKQVMQALNGI